MLAAPLTHSINSCLLSQLTPFPPLYTTHVQLQKGRDRPSTRTRRHCAAEAPEPSPPAASQLATMQQPPQPAAPSPVRPPALNEKWLQQMVEQQQQQQQQESGDDSVREVRPLNGARGVEGSLDSSTKPVVARECRRASSWPHPGPQSACRVPTTPPRDVESSP